MQQFQFCLKLRLTILIHLTINIINVSINEQCLCEQKSMKKITVRSKLNIYTVNKQKIQRQRESGYIFLKSIK